MTRDILSKALRQLEAIPPANVYAGRKGICMALNEPTEDILAFRRVAGGIQVEKWLRAKPKHVVLGFLRYPDLIKRATVLLDRLP